MSLKKNTSRQRRHDRIRGKISGTAERPRLVVSRSIRAHYAQLVDDTSGRVLLATNDMSFQKEGKPSERAKRVGMDLAKKALEQKISTCVFDRNGYKYHGRVKALAEGAREGGLQF